VEFVVILILVLPPDFSIVQRLQAPTGKKGLKIRNSAKPKDLTLRMAVITSALGLIVKTGKGKFLSTELMRYICRLVTPPNGTILDCFVGSGSTGKGAVIEGFNFIGIDKEQEYLDIAEKRITAKYLPLFQEPPRQPTQREPDKRDSAASQAFSQPDFLSDLEGLS
jgi:hypothetical protein